MLCGCYWARYLLLLGSNLCKISCIEVPKILGVCTTIKPNIKRCYCGCWLLIAGIIEWGQGMIVPPCIGWVLLVCGRRPLSIDHHPIGGGSNKNYYFSAPTYGSCDSCFEGILVLKRLIFHPLDPLKGEIWG